MLVTGTTLSPAEFDAEIERLDIMSAKHFQRLCELRLAFPAASKLRDIDPFSDDYRTTVLELYATIKQSDGYDPARDEKSFEIDTAHLFSGVSPWSLKDTRFMSEFMFSWAHIFRLLDLENGGSVLEYGPGSGQILLMLARLGVEAYGVDIDQQWLDIVHRQAEAMDLRVNLERNFFGKGFEGKTFDRILFFESFHHAIDFLDVLENIKPKLNPGGFIVFCGEPILGAMTDSVPYPWGPRLDGASVYCIRKKGWMELGFTHDFFTQALRRAGYDVAFHQFIGCDRAVAYTAKPGKGLLLDAAQVGVQSKQKRNASRPLLRLLRDAIARIRSPL
jgi:2-polyprenyl-3-methyl-5-hydroxy-6-metoxy-1,4-benzoquinol methylase